MKKRNLTIKVLMLSLALILITITIIYAQPPPPPPGPDPPGEGGGPGVPLQGNLLLLITAGITYFVQTVYGWKYIFINFTKKINKFGNS